MNLGERKNMIKINLKFKLQNYFSDGINGQCLLSTNIHSSLKIFHRIIKLHKTMANLLILTNLSLIESVVSEWCHEFVILGTALLYYRVQHCT